MFIFIEFLKNFSHNIDKNLLIFDKINNFQKYKGQKNERSSKYVSIAIRISLNYIDIDQILIYNQI